jgi:phosphoenolpyruvate carboxykinase (GTP)
MEPPVNTIDISKKIGKISSVEDARLVFEKKIDKNNLSKLLQIKHPDILIKIANAIVMCNPDTIFINTGTDEDMKHVRNLSLKNKEESPLAIDNHTIHFDLKEEQGRIINRTFYIADKDEDINSLANKMDRIKALD